jgi:hypothetical protein
MNLPYNFMHFSQFACIYLFCMLLYVQIKSGDETSCPSIIVTTVSISSLSNF